MNESDRQAVRDVKARVNGMLAERSGLAGDDLDLATQSKVWTDACSFFSYVLWLPEECF